MHYTKLEEPPRERVRVHELAAKVGRSSTEILEILKQLGEFTPSHMAFLESPVIRKVYDHLGVPLPARAEPRSSDAVPPQTSTGLTPPRPQTRRDNHPLMEVQARPRETRALSPRPPRRSRTSRPARFLDLPDQLAQAYGSDIAHAWEDQSWKLKNFTDVERDAWMAEGLRAGQAHIAAALRSAGLTPGDLTVVVDGFTVAARLAGNEGAKHVVRLLRRQQGRDAS